MRRDALVAWLDKELAFEVEDESCNGLQYQGLHEAGRVGLAVDACLESFELAAEKRCDFLIVHHGLFWKKHLPERIDALLKARLDALSESGISLYAAHLPLDAHPRYGNNAELFRLLGLKGKKRFAEYGGASIGFRGVLPRALGVEEFAERVSNALEADVRLLCCGPEKVREIGVCSGGGGFAARGVDCLVTGEFKHSDFHEAVEAGVNVVEAGHYVTETLGVKALGCAVKKKFGVETIFLDAPTGL